MPGRADHVHDFENLVSLRDISFPTGVDGLPRVRSAEQDRLILVDRSFNGMLGLSLLCLVRGWRSAEEVRVPPTQDALAGIEMMTGEPRQSTNAAPETRFAGEGACYVEVGDRLAAKGAGDPPAPAVTLQPPSEQFHQRSSTRTRTGRLRSGHRRERCAWPRPRRRERQPTGRRRPRCAPTWSSPPATSRSTSACWRAPG
jgi:hypothetical protein